MEIFKAVVVLALVLVPLSNAVSVEEELAHLKEIVHALEARLDTKVDIDQFDVKLNDTEELEARVTVLEESVSDLEADVVELIDEVDDIESLNILQEERLNTLDVEVNDNINDIEDLVDTTTALQNSVDSLDLRVGDLESGGGGAWDACDSSPCRNNATCIDVNVDRFICACTSGYFGVTCSDSYTDATFLAVLTTTATSTRDPLIFDDDAINPGGHYSTDTGRYTVPYDGIYQFSVHLQYYSSSVYFNLEVDDSTTGSHSDYTSGEYYRSTTILLELEAGQTVHVTVYNGARAHSSAYYSYFTGYLVSPTY